jgi:hypothetical protein
MKKITTCIVAMVLSLTFNPVTLSASSPKPVKVERTSEPTEAAQAKQLIRRLDEIKALDVHKMSAAEKKTLLNEVKTIKGKLEHIGGGVYISAGALIVILILILLLA